MRGRVTPVSLMGNADNHGGKGETGRCELLQANAFTDYRNSANRARASMLADWSPPEADIGVICFRGVANDLADVASQIVARVRLHRYASLLCYPCYELANT